MPDHMMLSHDIRQIRELANALRDLENALANSGISTELEVISNSLAQLGGIAQAPITEIDTLQRGLSAFNGLVGTTASILSIGQAIKSLGGPKVAAVAATISAVTLAINLLGRAFGNNQPPVSEFTQSLNESREAHQNLRNELDQGQRSTSATARALLNLADATSDCASTKRIMQGMINELNSTVPGLGLAFGKYGNSINMSEEALLGYIAATAGLDNHEANLARLGVLYREHVKTSDNLTEAQKRLAEAKETGRPIFDEFGNVIMYTSAEMQAAQGEVRYYEAALNALYDEITYLEAATASYNGEIAELSTQTGETLSELSEQWNIATEDIIAALEEQGISLDEWQAQQETALQELAEAWDVCAEALRASLQDQGLSMAEWQAAVREHTSNVVNGFRELPSEFDKTLEDMIEILYQNRKRYNAWTETMSQITEKYGDEVAYHLSQLGPAATEELQRMLDACDPYGPKLADLLRDIGLEGTTEGVLPYQEPDFINAPSDGVSEQANVLSSNNDLSDAGVQVIEGAQSDMMAAAQSGEGQAIGQALGNTVVDGATSVDYSQIPQAVTSAISSGQGAAVAAAGAMATGIQQKFEQMRQQAERIAQDMMRQMSNAITSETSGIHSAMQAMKTGIITALTPLPNDTNTIMQNTMRGMAQTVSSQRGSIEQAFQPLQNSVPQIMTATMNGAFQTLDAGGTRLINRARAIADAVAREMARALRVNSPSRVMIDLFGNVMDGIYVGMDKGEDSILKKAADIADHLKDALTIEPDFIDDMLYKVDNVLKGGVISPRAALDAAGTGRTISNTTHNSPRIELAVNYYGGANADADHREISKRLAQETAKALRGRGIAAVY